MGIYTEKVISPVGQVNERDLRKILRDTALFFIAPVLIYTTQLSGTLTQNGIILPADLIPSLITIGGIQGWIIGIVINFLLKLQNAKE